MLNDIYLEKDEFTIDLVKVINTFKTCITLHHFESAKVLFQLWRKKHGYEKTHNISLGVLSGMTEKESTIRHRELYGKDLRGNHRE